MAKLRHKNIVQFLGASCIPGKFAIVTEFIEFGSVSVLSHARGRSITFLSQYKSLITLILLSFALECNEEE